MIEISKRVHWKDIEKYKVYSPAIVRGDASHVYLGYRDQNEVAVKAYTSQWMFDNKKVWKNEINNMGTLLNFGLVPRLLERPFQTKNNIYLIMEFCNCGSLDMHIERKVGIPIEEIKEVSYFLAFALVQLKLLSILHRDINPRHILINRSNDGKISYKLTGLQFCRDIKKKTVNSFVGRLEYASPQAASEVDYSYEADVWSMGVTLYELAVGLTTLQVDPDFRIRSRNGKPPLFPPKRTFDPALRDLICKCLIYNPKERITAEMILDHPFLTGGKIEAPLPDPEPVPKKLKPKVDPSPAILNKRELLKIVQTNFEKYMEYVNLTENHKIKLKCERRTTLLPYKLKHNSPISHGGFGSIYVCTHNSTGEEYAIKVVATSKMTDVKIASLLLGEVIIMLELNMDLKNICPFAIRLVDYFVYSNTHNTKDDIPYKNDLCLVLEYCNGGDLDNHIRKRRKVGGIPLEELKLIAWNSACGLNEMHKRNMMHRDIKAKNVLAIKNSNDEVIDVKLCDYGLSKKVAEHQELMASTILGTLDYFAPELYEMMEKRMAGEDTAVNYTSKVDVWSYGVLLYFVLYGKTIMESPGSKVTVMKKRHIIYPDVKGVPDSYMDLIKKALTYDPNKRPSFGDLLTDPFFAITPIQNKLNLFPYIQGKLIGTGSSNRTKVYQCTKGSSTYAMKIIEGDSVDKKRLIGEIDTLTKLRNNNNTIKLYDYFAINNTIYLILEHCNGGDLRSYMQSKESSISTKDKVFIAYCILNGLKELHTRNIIHRDIHPNNILLILNHDNSVKNAVIGDFGYARVLLEGNAQTKFFTSYTSPEMVLPDLGGAHDSKTDIWSFGMLLYFLIFGIHADHYAGNQSLTNILKKGDIKYDEVKAKSNSELVELMKKCLKINSKDRPSAPELLASPIFSKYLNKTH